MDDDQVVRPDSDADWQQDGLSQDGLSSADGVAAPGGDDVGGGGADSAADDSAADDSAKDVGFPEELAPELDETESPDREVSLEAPTVIRSRSSAGAEFGAEFGGEFGAIPGIDPGKRLPGAELVGTELGHYRLEALIGAGGMGSVFRGTDTELGRPVAVKVISGTANSEEALRRFKAEAQNAARLDHTNIARVYYVGETKHWNYIVFEFVDGENLREMVMRDGALPIDDVLVYAAEVAEALDHASSRNVVHRDIKPSNIVLPAEGGIKLVDMGLARFHHGDGTADEITASEVILGTFDYISPEQARDSHNVDVRSDLYSLGCTMYFLLTASPPFPQENALQKLLSHTGDEPPDPRLIRPDLDPAVTALVHRLMAKDPLKRFQTPREFAGQLIVLSNELEIGLGGRKTRLWVDGSQTTEVPWQSHLAWFAPLLILIVVVLSLHFSSASEPLTLARPTYLPPFAHAEDSDETGESTPDAADTANTADPNTADPNTADPNTADPDTADPNTADPNTAGPDTAGPDTAGPDTTAANTATDTSTDAGAIDTDTGANGSLTTEKDGANQPTPREIETEGAGDRGEVKRPKMNDETDDAGRASAPVGPARGKATVEEPATDSTTEPAPSSASADRGPRKPSVVERSTAESEAAETPDVDASAAPNSPDEGSPAPLTNGAMPDMPVRRVVETDEQLIDANTRTIVVSDEPLLDEDVGLWKKDLASAIRVANDYPQIRRIELHYDGPRVQQPVRLTNKQELTISAAAGYTPAVLFRPDIDNVLGTKQMLEVAGSHLGWEDIPVRLMLPNADPANGWAVFALRGAKSLDVEHSTITIENQDAAGAVWHHDVSAFRISPDPRDRMRMPSDDRSEAPRVQTRAAIRLISTVVRGEASLLRTDDATAFRLSWTDGLFVSSQLMFDLNGALDDAEVDGAMDIELTRVTVRASSGLGRVNLAGRMFPVPLQLTLDSCIIISEPSIPLVEHRGVGDAERVDRLLRMTGNRNIYPALWPAANNPPLRERVAWSVHFQNSDPIGISFSDDDQSWKDFAPSSVVTWLGGYPSSLPTHEHQAAHYSVDRSETNPAARAGFADEVLPKSP
jgi:serine/threonine protein kinase